MHCTFKEADSDEAKTQGELLERILRDNNILPDAMLQNIAYKVFSGLTSLFEEKLRDDYRLKIEADYAQTNESLGPINVRFMIDGVRVLSTAPDINRFVSMIVKWPLLNPEHKYLAWIWKFHEDGTSDFIHRYDHTNQKPLLFHLSYIIKDHFELYHLPD